MIAIDCHVHVYPDYDLAGFLAAAVENLAGLSHGAGSVSDYGLLLTERSDCHFFRDARAGSLDMPAGWRVEVGAEDAVLRFCGPSSKTLWVYCGRQVVTAERLECFAWFLDEGIDDGRRFRDVQQEVLERGGVPVLPWAVGKWLFGRARHVRDIVAASTPESLVLCDSALRFVGWPEPGSMKRAREAGFTVVAGTDPLPRPGGEAVVGRYGILLADGFDPEKPVSSLKESFLGGTTSASVAGRRGSAYTVWQRMRT